MAVAGKRIGNYVLLKLLGEGGMGEVYAARQENLDRQVAIKFIRKNLTNDPSFLKRFESEARVTARIQHPGTVRIYDAGTAPDGRPFIVMELLEGESLADRLDRLRRLSLEETVFILIQVADAVQAAHDEGIIHRDLKPSNIFLLDRSSSPLIKVLDFGIAKWVGSVATTTNDHIIGTPLFMSPEQCRNAGDLDHRSDIYSLGAIAYQAVCGIAPFQADPNLIIKKLEGLPKPIHWLWPDIPHRFGDLIMRMLANDPQLRPPSMRDIATELREMRSTSDFLSVIGDRGSEAPWPGSSVLVPEADSNEVRSASAQITIPLALDVIGKLTSSPSQGPRSVDTNATQPKGSIDSKAGEIPTSRLTTQTDQILSNVKPDPAKRTEVHTRTRFNTEAVAAAPSQDAHLGSLLEVLPRSMKGASKLIAQFLVCSFKRWDKVDSGILRLHDVQIERASDYCFFAIFIPSNAPPLGVAKAPLGTQTFRERTKGLEHYIKILPTDARKVAVVLLESSEVSGGVREEILRYKKDHSTLVIPINLGELRKAEREKRSFRALFDERVYSFHERTDFYAERGPIGDPLRFFGMHAQLNKLARVLKEGPAFVSICGPPGSGKTSLVNVAKCDLLELRFISVRCSEVPEQLCESFASYIAKMLTAPQEAVQQDVSPAVPLRDRITAALMSASEKENVRIVLWLEDADWLAHAMSDPRVSDLERSRVREFFTVLSEQTRTGTLSVIVTSYDGHTFEVRRWPDWDNPLATHIRTINIPPLNVSAVGQLAREIGIEINVQYDDDAVNEIHRLSGGNLDVVKQICSRALRVADQAGGVHPLEAVVISVQTIKRAADDLAKSGETFRNTIFPLLEPIDRQVLQIIATKRPGSERAIKAVLSTEYNNEDCAVSISRLSRMGIIEHYKRPRITIPLFADWVRSQLEHVPGELRRAKQRRIMLVTGGAALTTLLFAAYWQSYRTEMVLIKASGTEGCEYSAKHLERAAAGDNVTIYIQRDCASRARKPGSMAFIAAMGTNAYVEGRLGGKENILSCEPSGECREIAVAVQLVSPNGDDYHFLLNVEGRALLEVHIRDDRFAKIKHTFDNAFKIAAAVPAVLGLIVAFYKDMLTAVVRIVSSFRVGSKRLREESKKLTNHSVDNDNDSD